MADAKPHSHLSRLEAPELIEAAAKIAGFDLGTRPTFGTAANVSGVRTRTHTFSRRRDSLTIFATDSNYGHLRKAGAWIGSDRSAAAACRRVLRAARVPRAEVAGIDVIAEHGAVAERLSDEEVRIEKPELLRKIARARRAVDGIPVWSSHLVVGLTRDGEVGHLELHWPHLAPELVKEATVLREIAKDRFKTPHVPDGRVESIEAGIVHSPAIGFFMDSTASIRVIFIGDDPTMGRKPTLYLDRHGEPITPPRDIHPAKREETERPTPAR
jgi:hypothetical protein